MLSSQLNSVHRMQETAGDDKVAAVSGRSPNKRRSLSDASSRVLSPSPKFREPAKKHSKDDISLNESPTTPRRPSMAPRGLSLHMPPSDVTNAYSRIPLSPKLDVGETYGSPVIPRRSRGLDFSRAATNLHHSTLAEQSSPECSSPTLNNRAMNIPNRRSGQFSLDSSNNFAAAWGPRTTERSAISSSLGSVNMMASDSSETSDEDIMDADEIEDAILTTPHVQKLSSIGAIPPSPGNAWLSGYSPAMSSLMNFQQRTKHRRSKHRKYSTSSNGQGSTLPSQKSRSPPMVESVGGAYFNRDLAQGGPRSRRESISWAANQLHISGSESDDGLKGTLENADGLPSTPNRDGQRGVIKRVVTRRGNMLPKTKGFARIRAALAEESTPVETEVRREANVVRQVRENEMELEPTRPPAASNQSSPNMNALGDLEDIPEDYALADSSTPSVSSSFKNHAMRNSKGKDFWDNFEDIGHKTPPSFLPRDSSSGLSDDMLVDLPSQYGGIFQSAQTNNEQVESSTTGVPGSPGRGTPPIPTAADITRKINKRRRDDYDDYDPASFKRRAVSPGMSIHNSPVLQSPMQRDVNPWGTRPPSNSGSEKGQGEGTATATATVAATGPPRPTGTKRVGLQGMTDTSDGLMKMSIE